MQSIASWSRSPLLIIRPPIRGCSGIAKGFPLRGAAGPLGSNILAEPTLWLYSHTARGHDPRVGSKVTVPRHVENRHLDFANIFLEARRTTPFRALVDLTRSVFH